MFLHGSGERGTDLNKLSIHGPLNYIKTNKLDVYILVPQCPQDKYWDSEQLFFINSKDNSKKIKLIVQNIFNWFKYGSVGCMEFSF